MLQKEEHMQKFIDYLGTVYANCNQHLLEQGKKRDQAITFYIVLISFVYTNFEALNKDFFGKPTQLLYSLI